MINVNEIEKQIQLSIKEKIETELQTYNLYDLIEQQIQSTVKEKVNATVTGLLNRLINSNTVDEKLDSLISADLQQKLDVAIKSKVANEVSRTDLVSEISNAVTRFVDTKMSKSVLPENFIPAKSINWTGYQIPPSLIGNGSINNFSSQGIDDHASDTNLTVLDGQVVVEHELISNRLNVVTDAYAKTMVVENLTIEKNLNIHDGKFAEQIKSLIDTRIQQSKTDEEYDLNGKALKSNQQLLIDNKSLGNTIIESNLRKVGRLTSLNVIGETTLAETIYVSNGRLGLNTDEPAGVFTAWDEESEVTIRKYKNRTMYIGSIRDSELVLGVAGNVVVAVRKDGIELNKVKIGNVNITSSVSCPTHRGHPGDLAINSGTEKVWAWRCTGGEVWVPMV